MRECWRAERTRTFESAQTGEDRRHPPRKRGSTLVRNELGSRFRGNDVTFAAGASIMSSALSRDTTTWWCLKSALIRSRIIIQALMRFYFLFCESGIEIESQK